MTKLRPNPAEDRRGCKPAEPTRNVFSLDALCLLLGRMRTNKPLSGLTFYEFAAGFKIVILGYVCASDPEVEYAFPSCESKITRTSHALSDKSAPVTL